MEPRWYFEDPERAEALLDELRTWRGTPFRAHSKAKGAIGGGVDCIGLCEASMIAIELTEPFEFPRMPMDYSMHCDNSIMLEYLRGTGHHPDRPDVVDPQSTRLASIFAEIDSGDPPRFLVGDLVTFKIGRCAHHLSIAVDKRRVIQVFAGGAVDVVNIDDSTLRKRYETTFRARAR